MCTQGTRSLLDGGAPMCYLTLGKLRQEACHRFDSSLQSERSLVITI